VVSSVFIEVIAISVVKGKTINESTISDFSNSIQEKY